MSSLTFIDYSRNQQPSTQPQRRIPPTPAKEETFILYRMSKTSAYNENDYRREKEKQAAAVAKKINGWSCAQCGTFSTTLRRKGHSGETSLCNACGLQNKKATQRQAYPRQLTEQAVAAEALHQSISEPAASNAPQEDSRYKMKIEYLNR